MRHYLIIVEGAHDIALIEKILRVNGVKEKISSKDKTARYMEENNSR